jgi:hypothetical protein
MSRERYNSLESERPKGRFRFRPRRTGMRSEAANSGEIGTRHWSCDYVEHLRTVHFSLIATSVALFVLATSRSPTEIQKAHAQAQQIIELSHDIDSSWFEHFVPEKIRKARPLLQNADTVEFDAQNSGKRSQVMVPIGIGPNNWLLRFRGQEYEAGSSGEASQLRRIPEPLLERPGTLREFRIWWDSLLNVELLQPSGLDNHAYIEVDPAVFEKVDLRFVHTGRPAKQELQLYSYTQMDTFAIRAKDPDFREIYFYGLPTENPTLSGKWGSALITIPIFGGLSSIPYDAQSAVLLHASKLWDWRHGKFDSAFYQLSQITKNYENVDLVSMEQFLAGEEKGTGESFEVLGIRCPAENTTRWGALVLIGIQIHFWIHLRELRPKLHKNDPGWDVEWLGMYSSPYARTAMFVLTCLLPAAATLALGIRGLYISSFATSYKLLLGFTAALSLLAGWFTWRLLPHAKGRIDIVDSFSNQP